MKHRLISLPAVFLSTVCFLSELKFVAAAKFPCAPRLVERLRPLNTSSSTMTMAFQKDRESRSVVANLIEHFRYIGSRDKARAWVCETDSQKKDLLSSATEQAKHFNWPELYFCVSEIGDGGGEGRGEDGSSTYPKSKKLFQQMKEFTKIVRRLGPKILKNYGLNWDDYISSELLDYDSPDLYRYCEIASSLAYRLNGQWGVAAMLTNIRIDKVVREFERGYFKEPVSLIGNAITEPLSFSLPTRCPKGEIPRRNGTAIVSTWGGVPSWSHFGVRRLEDNPAAIQALARGEHQKELVEDSDTLSNLSILLLPSALALVPIGLFQDVSLSLTLLYALATDVVSVLPVAIKGIELIWYGTRTHHATNSYIYGAKTTEDVAMAETWVASCGMKSFVREKGIALLTAALATMVIGIALEFITRSSVSKHRRRREECLDSFSAVDRIQPIESGGLLSIMGKKW